MRQQNVADAAAHFVRAIPIEFCDDIGAVIDKVLVVARATDQRVGTRAAVQRVVAGQAADGVAVARASQVL